MARSASRDSVPETRTTRAGRIADQATCGMATDLAEEDRGAEDLERWAAMELLTPGATTPAYSRPVSCSVHKWKLPSRIESRASPDWSVRTTCAPVDASRSRVCWVGCP